MKIQVKTMIYLDNAATTFPKPQCVTTAFCRAGANAANPGRGGHSFSVNAGQAVFSVRERLSQMFGCECENVIFTKNCTESLNTVILGTLKKGDHVIISSLEHNSVLRPITHLNKLGLITYSVAKVYPNNDEKTVKSFEKQICPKTKMIVCTHVSNVFGTVLPIKKISALAKKRGVLFTLDAAQSAGAFSVNMKEDGIDFLCIPGHKGLFGMMGTGVLMAKNAAIVSPLTFGGTGSMSMLPLQPTAMPDKFESGTLNYPGIVSLGAGIDFVKKLGIKTIHCYENSLIKLLMQDLSSIKNVKVYSDLFDENNTTLLSFSINGMHSEQVGELLSSFGFAVRGGYHCACLAHEKYSTSENGTVRVSPGIFTTKKQIKNLAFYINKIAKG